MSSQRKRKNPRFVRRYPVTVKAGTTRIVGFTVDISSCGMAIASKKRIDGNRIVNIDIKVGRFPIHLMGQLRWCKRASRADTRIESWEMGIELQSRKEDYLAMVEKVSIEIDREQHQDEAPDDLHISYETRWKFVVEYEKNLRNNQIFIATSKLFRVNQKIDFSMHLLEVMRVIHASGTVAYVVDEKSTEHPDKPHGIGIQIGKYKFEDEAMMKQFVKESGGKV